jgi:hypothetical protein
MSFSYFKNIKFSDISRTVLENPYYCWWIPGVYADYKSNCNSANLGEIPNIASWDKFGRNHSSNLYLRPSDQFMSLRALNEDNPNDMESS